MKDTEAVLKGFQDGNVEGSFGAGELNRNEVSSHVLSPLQDKTLDTLNEGSAVA